MTLQDGKVTLLLPKGEHLGEPLRQYLDGGSGDWAQLFSGDSDAARGIRFREDGLSGMLVPQTYRPKNLGTKMPDAGDFVVTTTDKLVDFLCGRYEFDFHDDAEVEKFLAQEGFRKLMGLEYNRCSTAVVSQINGNWRTRDPLDAYALFPFMTFRDMEREHDPNDRPSSINIESSGVVESRLIEGKGEPRTGTIHHIFGDEESYATGDKVVVAVVQTGGSLEKKAGIRPSGDSLFEFLYFSQPVLIVKEAVYERLPNLAKRIADIAANRLEHAKREHPDKFGPPVVIGNYSGAFTRYVNKHYSPDNPARRAAFFEGLGLPPEKPLATAVASYR